MTDARGGLGELHHRFVARWTGARKTAKPSCLLAFSRGHRRSTRPDMPLMSANLCRDSAYVKPRPRLGSRQEVNRVDDGNRGDIFLGSEVERLDAIEHLVGQ